MTLAEKAAAQIRDALCTLAYASDGHFEDEAQVALDALDWLEGDAARLWEALLWISEYPNRNPEGEAHAVMLAGRAREALV